MIDYNPRQIQFRFLCQLKGSVLPRAFWWAVVSAFLAILFSYRLPQAVGEAGTASQVWTVYNFVLAYILSFRSQTAYSRFWQGATAMQRVRAEWVNATSSLISFCTKSQLRRVEVYEFQHYLVRLVSLLYCTALQNVAIMKDERFNVLDLNGFPNEAVEYLASKPNLKCEIIMQWVQQLVSDKVRDGVLDSPPPMITRAYQELSRGIVVLKDTQEITDIPWPFPYAQLAAIMLILNTIVTPLMASMLISSPAVAMSVTFLSVFLMWSINFIAMEIECPFGDDPNDVPVLDLQAQMNSILMCLLDEEAQTPPCFRAPDYGEVHVVPCPQRLVQSEQMSLYAANEAARRSLEKRLKGRVLLRSKAAIIKARKSHTSVCQTEQARLSAVPRSTKWSSTESRANSGDLLEKQNKADARAASSSSLPRSESELCKSKANSMKASLKANELALGAIANEADNRDSLSAPLRVAADGDRSASVGPPLDACVVVGACTPFATSTQKMSL